ncbi:MAG: hypothetical protein K5634_07790 [Sphaerochaetaceae bacterium]|nr:hypothetical protein [Sphaerochaetaceae bacterium]
MKKLKDKISILKKIKQELEKTEKAVQIRSLGCCSHGGKNYYYYYENSVRKYVKAGDRKLLESLQQHYYNRKLLRTVKEEIEGYRKALKVLKEIPDHEKVFSSIPEVKRNLIKPYETKGNPFVASVMKGYGPNSAYESMRIREDRFNSKVYPTLSGYRVRSKDEVMITDYLCAHGFLFVYEQPLKLDGITYYPDFTLYNGVNGESVIWEHFGSVDDPEYAAKNFQKLEVYQRNGYRIGINLFITVDGRRNSFHGEDIEKTAQRIKEVLNI